MLKDEQTSDTSLDEVQDQPAGGLISLQDRVDGLSTLQQDRFYSIYPIFGERSFSILEFYKNKRVPNQWSDFTVHVEAINDPEHEDYNYLKSIAEEFSIGQSYRSFDLVEVVRKLRAEHKLEPIRKEVVNNCLKQLRRVFIVEEVNVEPDKHMEYKLVIGLMA